MSMIIVCIVLGIVSFVLAQMISVSQIVSLFKTRNTSGVSIWTYIIFMVAGAMCLIWGFSYYFQEMSRHAEIIHGTGLDDQGLYVLYQWEVIPIISYYITDFCMSTIMTIIKARHISLCKKLNMDEIQLAEYLKQDAKDKYFKSHKKWYFHPNFTMSIILAALSTLVVLFCILFTFYARPTVEHDYNWEGFPWVMWTSLFSALLWEAVSWPQFIKSLKHKDTSGISMNWAIFLPVAMTVSFSYALALALKSGDFQPDTIGALIFNGMIVNYGILILKIINKSRAKKMGLSEFEYTKKVLIPAYNKKEALKPKNKEEKKLIKKHKKEIKQKELIKEAVQAQKIANAITIEKNREWKEKNLY